VSGLSDEAYIERLEREANKLEADVATLTAERDRLREESETLGSFAEYQGGLIDASVAREHALAARLAQAERVVDTARAMVGSLVGARHLYSALVADVIAAVDALDGTAGPGEEGSDGASVG